jgi:hypothetical protein
LTVCLFAVEDVAVSASLVTSLLRLSGNEEVLRAVIYQRRQQVTGDWGKDRRFFEKHEGRFSGERAKLDAAAALVDPLRVVVFNFGPSRFSTAALSAISEGISPLIRRECIPAELSVTCGDHPILQSLRGDEEEHLGATRISVKLFGYSTPARGLQFYECLRILPWFVAFRRKVEELIGPTFLSYYLST